MKFRTMAVTLVLLTISLCLTLASPARAQLTQPDSPGHGSAVQAPVGGGADLTISSKLPSFLLDGFARMALAVSGWRLTPAANTAATRIQRTTHSVARAGR